MWDFPTWMSQIMLQMTTLHIYNHKLKANITDWPISCKHFQGNHSFSNSSKFTCGNDNVKEFKVALGLRTHSCKFVLCSVCCGELESWRYLYYSKIFVSDMLVSALMAREKYWKYLLDEGKGQIYYFKHLLNGRWRFRVKVQSIQNAHQKTPGPSCQSDNN